MKQTAAKQTAPPTSRAKLDLFSPAIYRRAFSSSEALGYEALISSAVYRIVAPLVDDALDHAHTGEVILDVGCGGGRLASHLAGRADTRVVGVDLSRSQVRRTARRGHALPVLASAEGLPFSEGAFDAVVSSCALKHWSDPGRGLLECFRVLRSGGRVVVIEIDGDAKATELQSFARTTRFPPGLRRPFVEFTMRTVVRVAPNRATLHQHLDRVFLETRVAKVTGLPFSFSTARR